MRFERGKNSITDDFDFEDDEFVGSSSENNGEELNGNNVENALDDMDLDIGEDFEDSAGDTYSGENFESEFAEDKQQVVEEAEEGEEETSGITFEESAEATKEANEARKTKKILYFMSDRPKKFFLGYLRDLGIAAEAVYSDLTELRSTLLIQTEPCRLVITDTGMGKLTALNSRKALIDILGLCDDNIEAMVFYTDSVLKSDARIELGFNNPHIVWNKYISSADTIARVLALKEEYVYSRKKTEPEPLDEKTVYRKKGMQGDYKKMENIGGNTITKGLLDVNMLQATEGLLDAYEPHV